MYAYAANNPVHYTDPDGREVIIGISKGTGIYKYIDTGHVFIMYIDNMNPENSIMLDASGQYGGNRGSSDVFEGNARFPITIRNYLGYFKTEKETLTTFNLNLTKKEEQKVFNEIEKIEGRTWLTCAISASNVIYKTGIIKGFKRKITPNGLLKELNSYSKANPDKVVVKQYDFQTGRELINEEAR